MPDPLDFSRLEGYTWLPNGQSAFHGRLLELYRDLDLPYARWSREFGAEEHFHPVFIPVSELDKMKYFNSFPHLATFPANLERDQGKLDAFAAGKAVDGEGRLAPAALEPIRQAMTPAPCYHLYPRLAGRDLDRPLFLSTKNFVFRREEYYQPLRRQWCFTAREIVCLGTYEEVQQYIADMSARWEAFFKAVGVSAEWKQAQDPFFNPGKNPNSILQKLAPVKREMTFQGELALGSANFHRNYFGEAFGIKRGGRIAFSGCVGWGLERLIYAILAQHGVEARNWPDLKKLYC